MDKHKGQVMKAIGYIRVSTTGQAMDGVSMEVQRARIEAWSEAHGFELADVFVDAGVSGKRADNRAGLQNALQAACKARGTALVVYSLSRLARSTKDAIAIAERLDRAGADLVSLSERIDTTTAAGKMVFRMLAVLAEFERDLVSERTTAALAHKAGRGERVGEIPFGWTLGADGVTLVENPAEQSILADIRELRSDGWTYRAIASELTSRRVLTKKGNRKWTHQSVASILKRRVA